MDPSLDEHARREAADPATAASRLSELARDFPAVRPIIARNPSTYEALLLWLGALDDPAVTEALHQRGAFGSAGVAPELGSDATPTFVAASAPIGARLGRLVWAVVGAATLGILALGVVLAIVLSGFRVTSGGAPVLSGGLSDEQQIEQVISNVLRATETYDCALLESTTTVGYRTQINYDCQTWHSQLGDATVRITSTTDSISINGNAASVTAHGLMEVRANPLAELQSAYVSWEFGLEKVDGTWLVASGSASQY